jgi:hypothetical protein
MFIIIISPPHFYMYIIFQYTVVGITPSIFVPHEILVFHSCHMKNMKVK